MNAVIRNADHSAFVASYVAQPRSRLLSQADLDGIESGARLLFPDSLAPFMCHERTMMLDPVSRIRLRGMLLSRNLDASNHAECWFVIPGSLSLLKSAILPRLSGDIARLIRIVLKEEGNHQFEIGRFRSEVADIFGIPNPAIPLPCAVRISEVLDGVDSGLRPMAEICASIGIELVIGPSFIVMSSASEVVVEPVRLHYAWHLHEERGHGHIHRRLLREMWPHLGKGEREMFGHVLAQTIDAFLGADSDYVLAALCAAGLDLKDAKTVVADCCLESPKQRHNIVRACMDNMRDIGLFDDSAVTQHFRTTNLID